MENQFKNVIAQRRSYYALTNRSTISDSEIGDILEFAVKHLPSAFNTQTSRLVLLLGEDHKKFWNIVKETLRKLMGDRDFTPTEQKVDNCFAAGHGTVLFFEDYIPVRQMQEKFPSYKDNFPTWSEHTSAMHQLTVWSMLEAAGLGASLQHYNPVIDEEVRHTWNLPKDWKLIAQMPFGVPSAQPDEKEYLPLKDRVKVFKS